MEKIRLTQFSSASGCGCKMAPAALEKILQDSRTGSGFQNLLVGNDSSDDAAVFDLGNGKGLISTADFFTPIVDDAYYFGRIAAANAISDVYAMGGTPSMALALLSWPLEKLGTDSAREVLRGARDVCAEAGIPLAGGHSIDGAEPIFGLSVNGMVELSDLKKNNTAKVGDLLMLTKPLGTGILSTAQKRGALPQEREEMLHRHLSSLNSIGTVLGKLPGVHAMTDVTGFGLLGHLIEMAEGSGWGANLYYGTIPVIEEARAYLKERMIPDATFRNWNAYQNKVSFASGVNVMEAFSLLPDPQTNGGLLIAIAPETWSQVQEIVLNAGLKISNEPIGTIIAPGEKLIQVLP
ncbi:MAG: selenide, water dikinase SelD [Sediminibacterium sp.]